MVCPSCGCRETYLYDEETDRNAPMSVADAMTEFIGALHAHLYSASMTGRQKMTNNPKRGGQNRHQGRKPLSDSERTVTWCAKVPRVAAGQGEADRWGLGCDTKLMRRKRMDDFVKRLNRR